MVSIRWCACVYGRLENVKYWFESTERESTESVHPVAHYVMCSSDGPKSFEAP